MLEHQRLLLLLLLLHAGLASVDSVVAILYLGDVQTDSQRTVAFGVHSVYVHMQCTRNMLVSDTHSYSLLCNSLPSDTQSSNHPRLPSTPLRLRGLRNSSAILATLKMFNRH